MTSHSIKLSGRFEIPEALTIDHSYILGLSGSVVSIAKQSEDNGDYAFIYHIKPEYGEVTKENGIALKVVKRGSQSQRMRAMILGMGLDYEQSMTKIMDNLEAILEN